jgi:hypothetical protein
MSDPAMPFPLPSRMPVDLQRVLHYWEELRRGGNNMPFWDDVNFLALPSVSDRLMLIEVFDEPQRFRFNMVGDRIAERFGEHLASRFAHEFRPKSPLDFFVAQAGVTVEAQAPTFYRHPPAAGAGADTGYARIVLPLWGEGTVRKLLGGVSFGAD